VTALSEGSTLVELEARPLREAAPQRFQQEGFFLDLDTSRSGLSLFEESLEVALQGEEDADLYDPPLLKTFADFSRLFSEGIDRIEISDQERRCRVEIRPSRMKKVERLCSKTPSSQRIRLAGRLDTIRHSDRMFTLVLDSGDTLRGIAEDLEPGALADHFGQPVIVSGTAVFRPSGSVLRIEADGIEPATGDVSIWSRVPRPERRTLRRPQGPRSGINAVIGRWPGDETEEEILSVLEKLS
jgi:hypothetical protein